MWMFLFLFFMQANPNPCQAPPGQTQPPSLIVQVVDPGWLPIPGAEVTLKPLREEAQLKSNRAETDKDGYAKFFVPGDADYAIEARWYGFRRESLKSVHLFKAAGSSSPAYIQFRLRLSGPGTTVY
jgi:hypothetical protein